MNPNPEDYDAASRHSWIIINQCGVSHKYIEGV
jgi:hypothetical protein